MTPGWKRALFGLRVAVPVLLLAFIFTRIDLAGLARELRSVHVPLALYSLAIGYLLPVPLCVWRWQVVLRRGYGLALPFGFLLKHFWIGMFVGYFLPGGAGTDIYRIACLSRRRGGFKENAATVIGEKVLVLLANALLVMVSFPWIAARVSFPARLQPLVWKIYLAGWLVFGGLILALAIRRSFGALLGRTVGRRIGTVLARLAPGAGEVDVPGLLRPFTRWRNQLFILAATALIQFVACYGGRLMLLAVGVDLPLMAHVFVWNLMIFVFLLPISFGTIGVREATFISLFGLFGVAREPALAASFVGLASMLATAGLGGLVWAGHELRQAPGRAAAERPDD